MAGQSESDRKPARKPRRTAKAASERHEEAPEPTVPQTPEEILRAGLKAFRLEHLLGMTPPPQRPLMNAAVPGLGFPGLENFGFRKFEEVFDQRVAAALERLGWPDPATVQEMHEEIERLRAEVEALKAAPPARRRAARSGPKPER